MRLDAVRSWSVVLAVAFGLVAVRLWPEPAGAQPQPEVPPPPLTPAEPIDSRPLLTKLRTECSGVVSVRCEAMRGILRARMVDALEGLESGQDQRSLDAALAAVALGEDELDVRSAAVLVLRLFPSDQRVSRALGTLLLDPHPQLQEMAASVLDSASDPAWVRVAGQWTRGNRALPRARFLVETRQPPDLAPAGFVPYPGATPFPPADADRAVGLRTNDPVDRVTKFYAAAARTKALDGAAWLRELDRVGAPSAPGAGQDPEQAEMQRLSAEYARTRKAALVRRMQKLAMAAMRRAQRGLPPPAPRPVLSDAEAGVYLLATPPGDPGSDPWRTVRVVPLEKRGDRTVRAAVVYREEAIRSTVVQLVWDPALFGRWDRLTGSALHAAGP